MYTAIKFKGYKLFSDESLMELDKISNVNVIIGKNNSGKSSLLDIIEMVYDVNRFQSSRKLVGSLVVRLPITRDMVTDMFSSYLNIDGWTVESYWKKVNGKTIDIELGEIGKTIWQNRNNVIEDKDIPLLDTSEFRRGLDILLSERKKYLFRRLSAERNILPETEMREEQLSSTGEGASNLVRAFLNNSLYDENVIERELLDALNEIMFPEAEFESIRIQQISNKQENASWEIFLKERGCERVPLSKSGSGIKTIILVLLNLLVIPLLKDYRNQKIIYGFEELENNLHPAMQRKLFDYIYNFAVKKNTYIFLTTHSHIAINTFYDKEEANIYHVVKEGKNSYIKRIESYMDKTEILNDLDIKASDILQSNGIIWVEGPSDRIYIKKWLSIFCENKFEEGKHYQFLYYGGRLLSQYSAGEEKELINIITTNRNAAIVIDSDKRNQATPLNNTKKRIIEEFKNLDMFAWITKGKEIENYVPKEAISIIVNKEIKNQCEKYELFPDYIEPYYKNFTNKKVPFANDVKDYITKDNSEHILDLKIQIEKLYRNIEKWNK